MKELPGKGGDANNTLEAIAKLTRKHPEVVARPGALFNATLDLQKKAGEEAAAAGTGPDDAED